MEKLRELIDVPVKLCFYVGEGGPSVRDQEMYYYVGCVKKINGDGLLEFQPTETEAKRLEVTVQILDLNAVWIWAVDVLSDNWEDRSAIECPHCGKEIDVRYHKNSEYNNTG